MSRRARACEVCHVSVGEGGMAGEGVSRSGGRSGRRGRMSRGDCREVVGERVNVVGRVAKWLVRAFVLWGMLRSGGRARVEGNAAQ